MGKRIKRIVLTGGPAAGKTTLISRILKEFKQDDGWKVITIPETATELISGFGIRPFGGCVTMLEFQYFVVADQLLEETYRARGQGGEELALDIENSGIVMAPLIPWNISVSIPLVMLGADASAIPYEVLLYAIPLCYLLTKRRVFAAKGERI